MKTHDTLDGGTAARLAKYRAKADAFKPRACREYNENRTTAQIRKGTKLEFEAE
jgi:hypothetical protein